MVGLRVGVGVDFPVSSRASWAFSYRGLNDYLYFFGGSLV